MFDYAVSRQKSSGKPRYLTATISAVVHVVVLGFVIGLPILYANDQLPEPPDMLAFVVDAPPPPPPPPPAPSAPEPAKAESEPAAKPLPAEPVRPVESAAAVPVEAPAEYRPETGNEGAPGGPPVEPGFEKGVPGGIEGGVIGGIEGAPTPPPPAPTGPVRVGGKVSAPSLVNRVNPVYPPAAQSAQVEGAVVLEATVNTSGRVEDVRVLAGNPLLQSAAVEAVKRWRYEPLRLNGAPVPFILAVTVTFSLPR